MANWCYNYVVCTGRAEDIQTFKQVLKDGQEYMLTHRQATSLTLEDVIDAYFFDILIEEQESAESLVFNYETKWSPNLNDLAQLCKKFNLSMACEYSEGAMQIYGRANINPEGMINDTQIPEEFFKLIDHDLDKDLYIFNGKSYESEEQVIEYEYDKWIESQPKLNLEKK
jgi:hypothetical protein